MTTYTLQDLMYAKGTSEPVRQALQAQAAEIERLRVDAERWKWFRKNKIRPIYRPGHPRIEHYIDGQTIAWSVKEQPYADAIDAAIDAAMK